MASPNGVFRGAALGSERVRAALGSDGEFALRSQPSWPFYIIGWHPYKQNGVSRALTRPPRSPSGRAGGAYRGWGWSHTGASLTRRARGVTQESPQHATFSSRRAAVRAHPISKDGVRRRPPRPPHAPPAAACRSARLMWFAHKRQFNTESPPNSPHMRVLPSAPMKPDRADAGGCATYGERASDG